MTETPATPVLHRRKGVSTVWLVPVLAAAVGAWVWIDAIQSRGPKVTIAFASADGLEAGRTKLRFKSVEVGQVLDVTLNPDLMGVTAEVRMRPHTEPLLRDSTRFWIVKPRIGLGGISGLETLLSGAYIEVDPGPTGATVRSFTALEEPPQTPVDVPGLKFKLTAEERGSLGVGSPISHHGVEVGRIEGIRLMELEQGDHLEIDAWIEGRYASHVRAGSRFWNASGLDFSFGTEGLRFTAASLTTLLAGGVEFDVLTDESAGAPAPAGSVFRLYPDRQASMDVPVTQFEVALYFDGSVRGLSPDAPVELRGIRVGRVVDFGLKGLADLQVVTRVRIALEPARLGKAFSSGDLAADVKAVVDAGYRARLVSASLLTGALLVELVHAPDQEAVYHGEPGELEMPTAPSAAQQLASTVDKLPRIVSNIEHMSEALAAFANSEQLSQAGADAASVIQRADATIASLQAMLAAESAFQMRLGAALDEIAAAMHSLRELADTLEQHPEALLHGKESP